MINISLSEDKFKLGNRRLSEHFMNARRSSIRIYITSNRELSTVCNCDTMDYLRNEGKDKYENSKICCSSPAFSWSANDFSDTPPLKQSELIPCPNYDLLNYYYLCASSAHFYYTIKSLPRNINYKVKALSSFSSFAFWKKTLNFFKKVPTHWCNVSYFFIYTYYIMNFLSCYLRISKSTVTNYFKYLL
jgi:hypothetical protein